MKYFNVLVLALFIASGVLADDAKSDSHRDTAKQLLEAMNMDAQLKVMAENIKNMQARQMAQLNLPAEAQPAVDQYLNDTLTLLFDTFKSDSVKAQYVDIYMSAFSEGELKEILEFYESGAGKVFLERFPQVMAGITQVSEREIATIQPEMMRLQQEFQKKLEGYR